MWTFSVQVFLETDPTIHGVGGCWWQVATLMKPVIFDDQSAQSQHLGG